MNIPMILREDYPDRKWSLIGENYDGLVMLDEGDKPTLEELEAAWPDVKEKHEREAKTKLDNKNKIDKKIRELAVEALINSGDLPRDYKE